MLSGKKYFISLYQQVFPGLDPHRWWQMLTDKCCKELKRHNLRDNSARDIRRTGLVRCCYSLILLKMFHTYKSFYIQKKGK